MTIAAVTLCIHFADRLQAVLQNRAHFDRWLIVTVPDDLDTLELCRETGLEVCVYDSDKGTIGFEPVLRKSKYINFGIRQIIDTSAADSSDWLCCLDADLLLPGNFRDSLTASLPLLPKELLYELRGRRNCHSMGEFVGLRSLSEWEPTRNESKPIRSYFRLFNLTQPNLAYPVNTTFNHNDDGNFAQLFPSVRRLPFVGLHLKIPPGRVVKFDPCICEVSEEGALSAIPEQLFPTRSMALVLGSQDAKLIQQISGRFERVIVSSQSGTQREQFEERDCVWPSGAKNGKATKGPNVIFTDPSSASAALLLEDSETPKKIGAVFIPSEPSYSFLIEQLPHWYPLLSDDAVLCGTCYGFPRFPKSTAAIELLLGTPQVFGNGTWLIPIRSIPRFRPVTKPDLKQPLNGNSHVNEGIVLFAIDRDKPVEVITALHAIRKKSTKPLAVLKWGAEDPTLCMVCARTDAQYISLSDDGPQAIGDAKGSFDVPCVNVDVAQLASLDRSPFEHTLWLRPDAKTPREDVWFGAIERSGSLATEHDGDNKEMSIFGYLRSSSLIRDISDHYRTAYLSRASLQPGWEPEFDARFFAKAAERVEKGAAPELLNSPINAHETLLRFPSRVHVPDNVTILAVASPEDIDALRQNWAAIVWPENAQRIVYLDDIEITTPAVFFPHGVTVSEIDAAIREEFEHEAVWTWALVCAARTSLSEKLLYIDPFLNAAPGAQLFMGTKCQEAAYCSPGWTFLPIGKGGRMIARIGPPACMIDRKWFLSVLENYRNSGTNVRLEEFLFTQATLASKTVVISDPLACGWNG